MLRFDKFYVYVFIYALLGKAQYNNTNTKVYM